MIDTYTTALSQHVFHGAQASFPDVAWPWFHQYANRKLASVDPVRIPAGCLFALHELARWIPPPEGSFWDLDFYGAGLHLMPAGSELGEHRDAEFHPRKPWRRVASLVYFLNECEGGALIVNGEHVFPIPNMAVILPSQELHQVQKTESDRKTLSLFAWEIDHSEKTTTSAQFTC